MSQDSKISTQTAILLGSVIVAVAIFLGLRGKSEREAPPSTSPSPVAQTPASPVTPSPTTQAPATPTPIVAPPVVTPPVVVDRSGVEKEVLAALGKEKKTLTDKCFAPALKKKPEPANIKWSFNFTFDASGKQIARGVKEDRATSRSEVTQCVSDALPEIAVTPLGQSVFVEVPLELP